MPVIWPNRRTGNYYVTIKRKQICLGKDREAAEQRYHEIMANKEEVFANRDNVSGIIDDYLIWVKSNKSAATHKWYMMFLNSFKDHIGVKKFKELKPRDVSRWIDEVYGDKTDNTKFAAARCAKRMAKWAKDEGLVTINPIASWKNPGTPESREEFITQEQFNTLLPLARDNHLKDFMVCLWKLGARPQELRAAEISHYNPEKKIIILPRKKSKGKIKMRTIYLSVESNEIVKRLICERKTGHIFLNKNGQPWKTQAILNRFIRMRRQVDFHFSPYTFRHSFCMIALQSGLDTHTVSLLMGTSIKMIEKYYSHMHRNDDFLHAQLSLVG